MAHRKLLKVPPDWRHHNNSGLVASPDWRHHSNSGLVASPAFDVHTSPPLLWKLPTSTHACPARPGVPVSFFQIAPSTWAEAPKPRLLSPLPFLSLLPTHHRAGFRKPQSSVALTDTTAKQDQEKLRDISCWSRRTSHVSMCG